MTIRDLKQVDCLHRLFERQSAETPDATALVCDAESLSYAELNRRANRLAHRLIAHGLELETPVGLCLTRGIDMIVGMLGIMKAGGAYLPIDASYPAERIASIVDAAQLSILLTESQFHDQWSSTGRDVLVLEQLTQTGSEHNLEISVRPDHLAYVIYTSGSTGVPKGVMVEHRAALIYLQEICARFALGPEDRVLQFASMSFDAAVEEIFSTLMSGACLVLRTETTSLVPRLFMQQLETWNISKTFLPTAYWHQLTADLASQNFPLASSLRLILIAGEAARPESIALWLRQWPKGPQLINAYGPTEAGVGVSLFEIPRTWPASRPVPIGRPFAHTSFHLLDAAGQPVAPGVAGELHIGGQQLARGYLDDEALTLSKFIPDPFSTEANARLYRTGDLVRLGDDGNYEFVGRTDFQVKVRGFRIEPDEIERHILTYPSIREAVVVARENEGRGDKRLIAYFSSESEGEGKAQDLRAYLASRLPDYMIPSAFVALSRLPLTVHGKVDRKALPDPIDQLDASYRAPRTEVEATIARIFASVLGLDQVGIDANFFALGGHSLLATQVLSRILYELSVSLPIKTVFEQPTVAQISQAIAALPSALKSEPTLQKSLRPEHLPLSFAQQRLWFLDRLEGGKSATYNAPYLVELRGPLHRKALEAALQDIVARHEILRTRIAETSGVAYQVIDEARALPIASCEASEADALIARASLEPFDLANEWPLRFYLLRHEVDFHSLLIVFHHIATDGWSVGVLADELSKLYRAYRAGMTPELPPLAIQYADFALWQRNHLQGELYDSQLKYWRHKLNDAPQLNLPTDRPRPAVASYRGGSLELAFDSELTQKLEALSQQTGATLSMTLTAGFAALLGRLSQQDEIILGTPIANRSRVETENLIGFFVNTFALRIDLRGAIDGKTLLKRVRDVALEAYAHQDIPFEQVVEALAPTRSASFSPLFQAMISLQNQADGQLKLPGLEAQRKFLATDTAKFDLALSLTRTGDGLRGTLEFARDLFDEQTIVRMIEHYRILLQHLSEAPETPIQSLPLMETAQRQSLLVDWSGRSQNLENHAPCINLLIEEQARRTPDALAVRSAAGSLSYRELNEAANQLAAYLQSCGVKAGTGVLVGLCTRRSCDMLIGMLAIWKAGGAYVPLDPKYPRERLEYMLRDAGITLLLTEDELLAVLPQQRADDAWICLDKDQARWASCSKENLDLTPKREDLAYIIYTSGSTGLPKGVMVEHRHIAWTLQGAGLELGLTASDTIPNLASFAFDISLVELVMPLLFGACTHILDADEVKDLPHLIETTKDASVFHAVPSLMDVWLDHMGVGAAQSFYPHLRCILVGGEPVPDRLLHKIAAHFPNADVVELYGPTEATVISTFLRHGSQRPVTHCIGRPFAGTEVYVLDSRGEPQAIGVPGELYLGGASIARGYLHNPALSAEKFIPHPFFPESGSRLYKTGDLVRWIGDGNLEYLGRTDFQVKIRGFRIETGEIESRLREHAMVRDALVMARKEKSGEKRLVAYVLPKLLAKPERSDEQIASWNAVYDSTYAELGASDANSFLGWNSSYDGQPIPLAAMKEWQSETVKRIRALEPKHVYEIGVGTGLLLRELAPHCLSYRGSDFSRTVIDHLQQTIQDDAPLCERVRLEHRRADEMEGLPLAHFDLIVINSVVQYFPHATYLLEVLSKALKLLRPGGSLFIGDVRNLRLLRQFATAVQVHKANPDADPARVRWLVEQSILAEGELLLDPDFFAAFAQAQPDIAAWDIEIKRGHDANELTRYRYDVVLRTAVQTPREGQEIATHWDPLTSSLTSCAAWLQSERPAFARINGVPNARLAADAALALGLQKGLPIAALHERARDKTEAIEPEQWHELAARLGYSLSITWSASARDGSLDLCFLRQGEPNRSGLYQARKNLAADPRVYANAPYASQDLGDLLRQLRQHLGQHVPEFMIPSAFVLLESLPLSPNGKVDRSALPAPVLQSESSYLAPRDAIEAALVAMVGQLLGLEKVSVNDHFFDLGGHSLLATQLISRIRQQLSVDVAMRSLFAQPRLSDIAQLIREASPSAAAHLQPIPLVSRSEALRASFAQERLWFIDRLETESSGQPSGTYLMPLALRLSGPLDRESLERALQALVDRHETLRTTLREAEDQALQIIQPQLSFPLSTHDLRELSAEERSAAAAAIVQAHARSGFALDSESLFRAALVCVSEREHILCLNIHHSVSDGWSMGILTRELSALYTAFTRGEASPLAPLPFQYADFAAWQRMPEQSAIFKEQEAYWKEQLKGLPLLLSLPTDRPRPPLQTHAGRNYRMQIPAPLVASLRSLSQEQGVTLFMSLSAAFSVLLSRHANQKDVAFGTPVANRNRADLEDLIGFFANTLVIRAQLEDDPSFTALLGRMKRTCLDAFAHQDLPFEHLVSALNPARSLAHSPLFQVLLALQNSEQGSVTMPHLEVETLATEGDISKFDLALSLADANGALIGTFEYNADLFDRATIERFAEHFVHLLASIVRDPQRSVASLAMLGAEEKRLVTETFNATARSYPLHQTAHGLIEAQVLRSPQAQAVMDEKRSLSYRELNEEANRLAHHLRAAGVGPEVKVGLCLERSVEMMIGLLAILKAGGAYIPLDPHYPSDRLQFMVDDAGIEILLTQARFAPALQALAPRVLSLDTDAQLWTAEALENLPSVVGPEHLVYVIYTSGSTGRPKAAMNRHIGLVNRIHWIQETYRMQQNERLLQKTPFTFDVSVSEFFWPLSIGACLVMARPEGHRDPAYLVEVIESAQITQIHFVPSMLQIFLEDAEAERCQSLRRIMASGEGLPPSLVRGVLAKFPWIEMHNQYGPTECSEFTAARRCFESDLLHAVTIGSPIANTQLYILDAQMEPTPIGVAGELYIGGLPVGSGYLNRPDLTAERFVADPFKAGARLYKTGDLCRWLADGNIEYLGRLDFQVKIRGFRIELGEIENQIAQFPSVREVLVLARDDQDGAKRLVAYLVPQAAQTIELDALRAHLAAQLPEYMVPQAFVSLPAFPLNASGKVDRQLLPAPDYQIAAAYFVAARSEREAVLSTLVAGLLGIERVSVEANLFEMGFHSLLVTQLVSRVRRQMKIDLPLREVFAQPQIAALARFLDQASGESERETIPLRARGEPLAASFAQERLWFLDQLESEKAGQAYLMPLALRLRGKLQRAALESALQALVDRHESLRTGLIDRDGQVFQLIQASYTLPLALIDLSQVPPEKREEALMLQVQEHATSGFELDSPSLLRCALVTLAADDHALLINMHHSISDAWSMALFMRDFNAFYRAACAGQEASLAPLPLQYADYASWQRSEERSVRLDAQKEYWIDQLKGLPPLLDLPLDFVRPPVQNFKGGQVPVFIDPALSSTLNELGRSQGATLFMTLSSAFALLLGRYANQSDIALGTPIAHRTRQDLEDLIGFFVNTLVLRLRWDENASFKELLSETAETCLAAYAHQDLPFEHLVTALNPQRSLAHTPIFQVMFSLENTRGLELDLPELDVRMVDGDEDVAKFDLSLDLREDAAGIKGSFRYRTDLFERATIERMAQHFLTLLHQLVKNPERAIGDVSLLDASERTRILEAFNPAAEPAPAAPSVAQAFEAVAARNPQAIALHWGSETMSYGALNARSNQLAHELVARGIGPDRSVGLCVERSPELVIGLLAILKAGGTYLPLDPHYPRERLAFMLADAKPDLVLTQMPFVDRLPQVAVLCFDDFNFTSRPDVNLQVKIDEETPAYIIYTSGSSGQAKGVLVEQGAIAKKLQRIAIELGFTSSDRLPTLASFAFDISLVELLLPLTSGGSCLLLPRAFVQDIPLLLQATKTATFFHAVPSLMELWLASIPEGQERETYPFLRTLMIGGEAVSDQILRKMMARFPQAEVIELYGPTEATILSTMLRARELPAGRLAHCIGRPFPGNTAYVLSARQQLQAIGVPGELYLGGESIARHYLSGASESFLSDPFQKKAGARMYKTGDWVRWTSEGLLEYLGRNDGQVKVRGFRIELGEIESQILNTSAVHQAVVVVREDQPGDKRLIAYLTPKDRDLLSGEAVIERVREALSSRLPEYMMPSAYLVMETWPLSANGKIDRKALPAPGTDAYLNRPFAPPAGSIETELAAIWCEILRLPRVSRHDHFFDLGGHSLLATQLMSRISQRLRRDVPMRELFAAPVLSQLATRIEALPLREKLAETIPLVPRDQPLLASFAQERLWFIDQLEADKRTEPSKTYLMPLALKISGPLNVDLLEKALQQLVDRHETLRTGLAHRDGQTVQVIAPSYGIKLRTSDLRSESMDVRRAREKAEILRQAREGFELHEASLFRASLLLLGANENLLLITMHHAVSDGWSIAVLTRELGALYQALRDKASYPLPPLRFHYADYAAWERAASEKRGEELAYWTKQLSGLPPLLELPSDRPRPLVQTYAGASLDFEIPAPLATAFKAIFQPLGLTPFMAYGALFSLLLSRYARQSDIAFGSPIANRTRHDTEDLIGFFVNTLVLRAQVDLTQSFAAFAAQFKQTCLDAYAHQSLPFEHLVNALNPQRSLAHAPLFQVLFVMQNNQKEDLNWGDLQLERLETPTETSKFDLSLALLEKGEALTGSFEFNTDLFDAASIARMGAHFTQLLRGLSESMDRKIGEIPLLSEADVQALRTPLRSYPQTKTLHQAFEEQHALRPQAKALSLNQLSLSYDELNSRANRLAHYLQAQGVGPDRLVAICADRSFEMVIGILAILKAGGAYLPIDPMYPRDRIEHMLSDSKASILLTQEHLLASIPTNETQVLCLDRDAALWQNRANANPISSAKPEHLAYVIYTSGSSGKPKGVLIEHRQVARLFAATQADFRFNESDVWTIFHSFAFDFSVWELWGALLYGGRAVLVPPFVARSPREFLQLLAAEGVTVLNQTPAAFQQLIHADEGQDLALRYVIFGGDALDLTSLKPWYARRPSGPQLINMYGITETTVHVTYRPIDPSETDKKSSVIGRPIADLSVHLLDEAGHPVPIGVAGEIYVGGAGVARGYLNRPELTAERFIPDPFEKGARLYRSGDLARRTASGDLEYLGRIDFQVKIRGFRIELGEIEHRLLQHPSVREALVVAREDSPGDKRLVAYVCLQQTQTEAAPLSPAIDAWRQHLAQHLPDYMIPSAFVCLDVIPLTPHGKPDRKALPAPDGESARVYEAPVSEIEKSIARIWAEVLKVERVGRNDNFFELGGHSLLAVSLIERMRKAGLKADVRSLFSTSNLAAFAAATKKVVRI